MIARRTALLLSVAIGSVLAVVLPIGAVLVSGSDPAPATFPPPPVTDEGPAPAAASADASSSSPVVTPGLRTLAGERQGNVRTLELTASEVVQRIANFPVKEVKVAGYNGSTPGPTLLMREGERTRVVLRNELIEPTTLHFHGLHSPNDQDGVAGISQREPVPPGGRHVYEFTPRHGGTFAYHSHTAAATQTLRGLVGAIVVLPAGEEEDSVDVDVMMTLQQFAPTGEGQPVDPAPAADHFPISTINGRTGEAHEGPVIVRRGDRVRVRLYNASNKPHSMHMHGHDVEVVSRAGHAIAPSARHGSTTENVAPGEFVELEWTADNPGNWAFHCHFPHHTANDGEPGWRGSPVGMTSFFRYEDAEPFDAAYYRYQGRAG